MRTTSVFINKLGENGFPFSGKVKFTLMSTDPDFVSHKQPVSAFFINGKAKVQLIPNIFISRNVSTYYHYEIFAQHPVNSATEVEFELIEEGDCIVPIKPSCLQEILIPTQSGSIVSSCNCEPKIEAINSEIAEIKETLNNLDIPECNCEPYPKIVQIAADALNPNNPVSLSTENPTLLFIHTHQGIQASIDQLTGNPARIDIHLTVDPEHFAGNGTSIYRQTSTGNKYITVPDYIGAQYDEQYPQDGEHGLVPAATAGEAEYFLRGDGTWQPISINNEGTTNLIAGTGIVIENGIIRLAQKKTTTSPTIIRISSQYNTPYTYYDDGEGSDTLYNPSPYIINFPDDSRLTTVDLAIGCRYSTSDKATLQNDIHGVLATATWESGYSRAIYTIFDSSCWSSIYFASHTDAFKFKRLEEYPNVAVFDRIVKIELVALKENLAIGGLPYGTSIGTYFPANTALIIHGQYWD